jgi:23S rRNA pseudouridine2605 synthase
MAAEWIRDGRVRVNNRVVRDPEAWVHPDDDRVTLDGRLLRPKDRVYMLLNKPRGYLCTREDPQGRSTIYELLRGVKSWVFNVGRLDLDTSGLLILTNDTELGELLTNPDYKVPKTYLVKASTLLSDEQLQMLRDGVLLDDGPTQPATVTRLRDSAKYTHLQIIIHEGRNRQVRRMLEAIGSKVLKLVRTAIGPLEIGGLEIGKHRPMSNEEVRTLKQIATALKPANEPRERSGEPDQDTDAGPAAGANTAGRPRRKGQRAGRFDEDRELPFPGDGPEE